MRQVLILAGVSGLVGGLAGASLVAWIGGRPSEPSASGALARLPAAVAAREASAEPESALVRRLEGVERALSALQARSAAAPRATAPEQAAPGAQPASVTAPVVDPVFEAAVLDVLERAEEERDSERGERRKERARQQAEHWARQLTEQLALSPEQSAQLLEIRTQLLSELRERRASAQGRFVPRDERRAAVAALRERAEQRVRDVLAPQQQARYDQLDPELRLVRPPDDD